MIAPAPVTASDICDLSRWYSAVLPGITFTFAGKRIPIMLNPEVWQFIEPEAARTIQRHNAWLDRFPVVE